MTGTTSSVSGSVSVDGVWTGAEAASFRAVIAAFHKSYPNVKVGYKSAGDNLPTVLATSISGAIRLTWRISRNRASSSSS